MKHHIITYALAGMLGACSLAACSDKFDDLEDESPSWLGPNIYDYLKQRGDCNYFVRLIDDEGMADVMQLTGSNTVFFANDAAFERFFESNTQGIRSYEQLPESLKKMFLRLGVVNNAQLIERLSLSDNGDILLRRTTNMEVEDTIPVVDASTLPDNSYFAALRAKGGKVNLLQDATQWTLVQFFPTVMKNKEVTDDDFRFITGNSAVSIDSAYLYSNQLVKQDIVCKNGYLHELADVLTPPENMAGYIRSNAKLGQFSKLLDRFCAPVYYKRTEQGDSIYELRYFNTGKRSYTTAPDGTTAPAALIYDPGWNLYASASATGAQAAYEQTMGCMFVPTDEAMAEFFSATGEGSDFYNAFGTWDNVPTSMVADIINAHMKNNFLTALPSKFDKIEDENGYSMDVTTDDVADTYIARNGLVYVTNKVFAPQDYKTVMGPAKIDVANSLFNKAISDTKYSYYAYLLRAPKNTYYFFVTPDAYTKGYVDPVAQGYSQEGYRCKLDFYLNSGNNIVATPTNVTTGDTIVEARFPLGGTGIVSTGIKKRMNDILGTQTIVANYDGELEEKIAAGQEWFISNSYAPVHIKSLAAGGKVGGGANADKLTIRRSFQKSNGRTFEVDGLMQNSTTSIRNVLASHDEFSEFYDICNAIGIFSTASADGNAALDYIVSFLNQYHYTVYVPTNEAIRAAQQEGIIPTVSDWESEGDAEVKDVMGQKLLRFVRYHFQDNSVFIHGEQESGAEYLSATLNEQTSKFYPIGVTNTGKAITLKDATGRQANVVTTGGSYNLLARDIVVNNKDRNAATEITSYAYAVVHQVDKVLRFE